MILLAVDPGINGCGTALFVDGYLRTAYYATSCPSNRGCSAERAATTGRYVGDFWHGQGIDTVAIEFPQVYRQRGRKDPNDLLPLAAVLGALLARLDPGVIVAQYSPHQWKGSLDGDAMVERIKGRLSGDETTRVVLPSAAKTLGHNVWDAIGIGLKHLGRLDKRRVIAR